MKLYSGMINEIKNREMKLFRDRKRKRLYNKDFTILASDCNGTFMYHDMGLPFLSPTINLTIGMNDFVKMLENLEWYMQQDIVELKGDYKYPAGNLGGVLRLISCTMSRLMKGFQNGSREKSGSTGITFLSLGRRKTAVLMKRYSALRDCRMKIRLSLPMSIIRSLSLLII